MTWMACSLFCSTKLFVRHSRGTSQSYTEALIEVNAVPRSLVRSFLCGVVLSASHLQTI